MTNTKKLLLGIGALGAMVAPVAATVSCSLFGSKNGNKSNYQFWNYEDYIDEDLQSQIEQTYTYSQFGDLPEFKQALKDKTAAGGIGSDYFNAKLAQEGLIQKIDFSRLFGITTDRSQWKDELQKRYTPEAWKLLNSFTLTNENQDEIDEAVKNGVTGDDLEQIKHDVDHDGAQDYLWEFMAPYFIQNKVIGVNLARLGGAPDEVKATNKDGAFTISQADFEAKFTDKSYKGILDTLKSWGASHLAINDYMRDNLMIGSEKLSGGFTGAVADEVQAKAQINGFMDTVKGWSFEWKTSGVDNLASLIDNNSGNAEAALMYNGDALFAYNGGDIEGANEGTVRIITPTNPTFLLDGFVIASEIKGNQLEEERMYSTGRNILFKGANTSYKTGTNKFAGYASDNNVYKNFDYVGYTPAFAGLYDYAQGVYFGGDANAESIFASTRFGANVANTDGSLKPEADHVLNNNHITQPISDDLTIRIEDLYRAAKQSA